MANLYESDAESDFIGFADEDSDALSGFDEVTDEVAKISRRVPKSIGSRSKFKIIIVS